MPSINGGMKCIKYILFLFNLALVIAGIFFIWLGFSAKHEFNQYFSPIIIGGEDGGHSIPPNIFIAVGFIMFIIAFLGCCGAITENHCMMMLYSVLVGLVLVIQLGGAIAAYAFQDDIDNALSVGMENSMRDYYNAGADRHNETVRSWNYMQSDWKCCGVHGFNEWINATDHPATGFVPQSCCIGGAFEKCSDTIKADTPKEVAAQVIYTDGCLTKAINAMSITHFGTIGIALTVIELLGIICACMMARSIRYSYETV